MEPTYLKRLEALLRDLMDGKQLRRFIGNLFGRQITAQLPEECTDELLAHGTVAALQRNNLINQDLFVELVGERPGNHGEIEAVAQIFGLQVVPSSGPASVQLLSPRTPDYVIRDTYESLRRQRTLLRQLTHGEIHVSRLIGVVARQDDKALQALPVRVSAWIDENRHEFSVPDLQSALAGVHMLASLFAAQAEAGALGSLFALLSGQADLTIKRLYGFSSLSDQDLYALALTLASTR
jgi:hypothetical protein